MSLVAEAFNPAPRSDQDVSYPPTHDFWYAKDPGGYIVESGGPGFAISADTIMRCGTVLAAVRFRGDSWAMCPPSTFIKTHDGRREDPTHYSQILLRNPNRWQTGNRWRHLNGVWMPTWGNAYNEIRGGRRSFAEELWPMHPRYVRVVDQRSDGSLVYRYEPPQLEGRTLGQENVLHFRDISTDGLAGLEMYRLIRNTVAIALMAEQHAQMFLRKGTRISGLLVPANPLEPQQRNDLRESVNEAFAGWGSTGALGVLPHGVDLKPLSLSNRDSQFVELGEQVVGAILRFLGVPGVVVGYMGDKTATYASAKEFFESGGIRHTILPILTNVEAEEEKALLPRGDPRQIKHNLDALLRANWKDRIQGLVKAAGGPIFAVNEARAIEDFDRIDDPRYDRPHIPSNMEAGGEDDEDEEPPGPSRRPPSRQPDQEDEEMGRHRRAPKRGHEVERLSAELARQRARLKVLFRENAERVVRAETAELRKRGSKLAQQPEKWRGAVLEFYGKHAAFVSRVMDVDEEAARSYCDSQASSVLADGLAAAENWELQVPERLVALAIGADEEAGSGGIS